MVKVLLVVIVVFFCAANVGKYITKCEKPSPIKEGECFLSLAAFVYLTCYARRIY